MKMPVYVKKSANIAEHLERLGFSSDVQRKIGAFVVVWAMFETSLEKAVWAIRAENVKGVLPSTDKTPVSEWIKTLRKRSTNLSPQSRELIQMATTVADDILEYRNSIAHGHIVPYGDSTSFVRNPKWHGEQRTRPSSEAHVDENLLDMAIDTVGVLHSFCLYMPAVCADQANTQKFLALRPDITRARSQAGELRHLSALMNHEKW